MMLQDCLQQGTQALRQQGIEAARFEADLLLAYVLKLDRLGLYRLDPGTVLAAEAGESFARLVQRRTAGEPMAYILGEKEFCGLTMQVGPGVLIPRPETELLVDLVAKYLQGHRENTGDSDDPSLSLLDLCCGSGAVGICIARQIALSRLVFADCSEQALSYARKNIQNLLPGLATEIYQGDLLTPLGEGQASFWAIACNPPYIPAQDIPSLMLDVREYEPHVALIGGVDGLDFYRRLVREAPDYLYNGGMLAVEIGWDQGPAVAELFQDAGFAKVQLWRDFAEKNRVVTGLK